MKVYYNNRFVKKYAVGGSGIFDSIVNFFKRFKSSKVGSFLTDKASKLAASEIGKKTISNLKQTGKEFALSALDKGKDVAIDKVKKLIDKTSEKVLTDKNVKLINDLSGMSLDSKVVTNDVKTIVSNAIKDKNSELSNRIAILLSGGDGLKKKPIRIEDLVKRSGKGIRLAY